MKMADQVPLSTFIRPSRPKAIRITKPTSGENLPLSATQKAASTWPALPSLPKESRATSIVDKSKNQKINQTLNSERVRSQHEDKPTTQSSAFPVHKPPSRPPSSKDSHPNGTDMNTAQIPDIYARAFIPEALRIINNLDGYELHTPPMKEIDFGAYVRSHVGLDFLPPIPHSVRLPMHGLLHLTDQVDPVQYELYFRYHLEAEVQSQKQENEDYSLYGHEVLTSSEVPPHSTATCSLVVPGLRENSPYVEEDDIIELRQLRYDVGGKLFEMDQWLALNRQSNGGLRTFDVVTGQWIPVPAPGWTNTIHNARVSAILRKQEQLVVQLMVGAPMLMEQHTTRGIRQNLLEKHRLRFNVRFPVQDERFLQMRQVLAIVQEALRASTVDPFMPSMIQGSIQFNGAFESRRSWIQSMLFPVEVDCEAQTILNPGYFNRPFRDKELNYEQKKAIESICSHNYGTIPFLISGPPGTGKTKTLVEVAVQLVKNVDKVSHILFCAPSDPAADTVVQRISAHFKQIELLRLNRPTRTFAEVPGAVLPFCYSIQNKFDLPPFKQLMSYKIVVTTCRDASLLLQARLTNADLYAAEYGARNSIHPYAAQASQVELHWTALLMDESAQALEPEALIPLSVIAPPMQPGDLAFTPMFVMAGDENQLGPRTSLRASPLKTSLFARLFARPVYSAHPLARRKGDIAPPPLRKGMLPINRPPFANLIRNYRSHPAILAIPSALFYADTLEPEATDIDRLAGWPEWRGRQWPVLFRNNDAEDDLEMDGGGWYNKGEAQIACSYASALVKTGLLEQKEICIMTPFKAQVKCIRETIRGKMYGSLWDIDIGPTEAFQGLERGVVILCTTRSKQRFVDSDKKVDWGIIGLPNKMNVALTRAKFGLIVIGKQDILLQDPNWNAFLKFCTRNGLVADGLDIDEPVHDRGDAELTRLEKVLVAKERDRKELQIWGDNVEDDEMWTSGMEAALDTESLNDYDEYGDEENDDHDQ